MSRSSLVSFGEKPLRIGAIASSVGGVAFVVVGFYLKQVGLLNSHEIYPEVVASLVLIVAEPLSGSFRRLELSG